MRGFKSKKWTVLAMLYDAWQNIYVKVLNNKNTKDIDRLVRLSGDVASASEMVEKEIEETLKQADNEKYLRAQRLMKEMFEDLNESIKSVVEVPIHK